MQTPNIDRTNLFNFEKINKVKKKVRQSENIDINNLDSVKKAINFNEQPPKKPSSRKQSDNVNVIPQPKKPSSRKQSDNVNVNVIPQPKKPSSRKQSDNVNVNVIPQPKKPSTRKQYDNIDEVKRQLFFDRQLEKITENPQMKKSSSKKQSEKIRINFKISMKRNAFNEIYKYRNNLLESKLLPKKFNYIEKYNRFLKAMMLLNTKNIINEDDVKKIKYISFSQFKSKLLINRINDELDIDFFFSKNKNFLYKIINNLYYNKNVKDIKNNSSDNKKKLSPILEGKKKLKFGGSILTNEGKKFLSILAALDKKHDFEDGKQARITKHIIEEGEKEINEKIALASVQHNEVMNLFLSNKDYEEDILINTINHMMGINGFDNYFNNVNNFTSFAFIDTNVAMDKLDIYYKSQNKTNDSINAITKANVITKLIEFISDFYRFEITPYNVANKYKYMFDTDIKLNDIFKTLTDKQHFHQVIYDKIATRLFPFENAFDPHSSNEINIHDNDIDNFRRIIDINFNYIPTPQNKKEDIHTIRNIVNEYLGFQIKRNVNTIYHSCAIFKVFDHDKMLNFKPYKDINDAINPSRFITNKPMQVNATDPIIDEEYCQVSPKDGDSILFFRNSTIYKNPPEKFTYIKYACKSFNSKDNVKLYNKQLLEIFYSNDAKTEIINFLNDIQDIKNPDIILMHYVVAYLFYCNENINKDLLTVTNKNVKDAISNIIAILFDLKKAGDWGQSLFCSEYNKIENVNNKDCFFVTGDKLAAVRSLLCNNVKTILSVDYNKMLLTSNGNKRQSILALYRNKFSLTFKDLINDIKNLIFTLAAFEIFNDTDLKPEFFMKFNFINSPIATGKKKEDEIITEENFNIYAFLILINFLKNQMYIYLYMHSIVYLPHKDNDNAFYKINSRSNDFKTINIDYVDFKTKEELAKQEIEQLNIECEGDVNYNVKYDAKYTFSNEQNFNKYLLLHYFRLDNYSLTYIQDLYLNVRSNQQDADRVIRTYYTNNLPIITDNMKGYILNSDNFFNKIFELYNDDYKIMVDSLSNTINDCHKKLINIGELHETYSLLLCDDKFINLYDDVHLREIKNDVSKTAIKRTIDDNNKKITEFFNSFNQVYLNKSKFKNFTKDFITEKITYLMDERDNYLQVEKKLDDLKHYLDLTSANPDINGDNLIIYFKSNIKGDNNDVFLQSINDGLIKYWTEFPNEDIRVTRILTQKEAGLLVDYNRFISTIFKELTIDLYDYYKVTYPYLYEGFDLTKITAASDAQRKNIIDIISSLYENDYVKTIYGQMKEMTIKYKILYDKIIRRVKKINQSLAICNYNIQEVYKTPDTVPYILFNNPIGKNKRQINPAQGANAQGDIPMNLDAEDEEPEEPEDEEPEDEEPEDEEEVPEDEEEEPEDEEEVPEDEEEPEDDEEVDHLGDTRMDRAASGGSGRKRPSGTVDERPKRGQGQLEEQYDPEKHQEKIMNLYNRLKGGNINFKYNKETFKEIINHTMPFANFLKPNVTEVQNRDKKSPDEILAEIGFILYISDFFKQLIEDRASNVFKKFKKYFNDSNSKLTRYIIRNNLPYYFKTDYILIPIIAKYLNFIIKNKEEFILKRDIPLFEFKHIYNDKHKHKVDTILYNIDMLFNITKNIYSTEQADAASPIRYNSISSSSDNSSDSSGPAARSGPSGRGRGRGGPSGPAASSGPAARSRGNTRGNTRGRGNSRGRGRGGPAFVFTTPPSVPVAPGPGPGPVPAAFAAPGPVPGPGPVPAAITSPRGRPPGSKNKT